MGGRPGVLFLALPAIPFVNLGQLPTLHFSFTIESSGHVCDRITIWESLKHFCRTVEEWIILPDSNLLGQDYSKYEGPDSMNFPQLSSSLVAFVYCNSVGSPKASSELKRFWKDYELCYKMHWGRSSGWSRCCFSHRNFLKYLGWFK